MGMKMVHNAINCGVAVWLMTFFVLAIVGCVSAPLYTNSVRSAASSKLMSAAGQTKTQKEAEKLQETTICDERKKIDLRYGFVAKVLFVNEDVKAGTVLTKDMLCSRDYIAMGVRDRCLHVDDLKSVLGRKLAFDLKRGSILLKTDICEEDGR